MLINLYQRGKRIMRGMRSFSFVWMSMLNQRKISRMPLASSIVTAVLIIGLFGASAARAAGFEIVMSQDHALCQDVLSALNNDLTKHGELRLADHPAIPAIGWRPMNELGSPLKNTDGVQFRWARFDSNNDGVEELVIKRSAPFNPDAMVDAGSGVPADDLYIFPVSTSALTQVRDAVDFGKAFVRSGIGLLHFGGYFLRDPAAGFDDRLGWEVVMNAFRYQGTTYYHIDPIRAFVSNTRMHLVITHKGKLYPSGSTDLFSDEILNEAQEVCYFKMPITIEHFAPLHRSDDGLVVRP